VQITTTFQAYGIISGNGGFPGVRSSTGGIEALDWNRVRTVELEPDVEIVVGVGRVDHLEPI
jgi:hypothetical protein